MKLTRFAALITTLVLAVAPVAAQEATPSANGEPAITTSRAATRMPMHPRGAALPLAHQGPFVTADGGVMCINAKEALRSQDDGKTWSGTPLFTQPEKLIARDGRALLRTREPAPRHGGSAIASIRS